MCIELILARRFSVLPPAQPPTHLSTPLPPLRPTSRRCRRPPPACDSRSRPPPAASRDRGWTPPAIAVSFVNGMVEWRAACCISAVGEKDPAVCAMAICKEVEGTGGDDGDSVRKPGTDGRKRGVLTIRPACAGFKQVHTSRYDHAHH